ncbi:MAG: ThuA domain-containing protein [candidate division KSB1 bacterium]|nr:ThuA domain-containing protein [candidate division KSB1 bacterium]
MVRTVGALLLVFCVCLASAQQAPGVKVLLITGESNHDWRATTLVMRQQLEEAGIKVVVSEEPAVLGTPAAAAYDAIVLHYNRPQRWDSTTERGLIHLVRDLGKGLVVVHSSNNAFPGWKEFEEMIGLAWREGAGHDRYGRFTVRIVDPEHPITSGLTDFETTDELYRDLTQYSPFHILAVAHSRDKDRDYPMIFIRAYGEGRVFHTVLGHSVESMQCEGFRLTFVRGTLWAAGKL